MRASWERNRFLVLFAAVTSVMGVSVGMARVATSLYALELGASETVLGLIASGQSIGLLLMSLPAGALVDQLGPRPLFLAGTIVAGVTYLTVPLVPSPWFLLACTTVASFCMPTRFVPLNAVFMQQLATVGEAKAGWYRGTHMTGMALAGPVLAAGAAKVLGYPATYGIIGGLFAVSLVAAPVILDRYAVRGDPRRRVSLRDVLGQLALLGDEPELRGACLDDFCVQAVNAFYTFFIVVIAIQALHAGPREATQLLVAQGGAFIAALFLLGALVSRVGVTRLRRTCLGGIACGLLVLGLGRALGTLLAGGLLLGSGLGVLQISTLSRFATLGTRLGRGRTAGLEALFGPAGALTGSAVGGALGHLIGLQPVFLVLAAIVAALAFVSGRRGSATAAPAPLRAAQVQPCSLAGGSVSRDG
ncbi:MFS transporter [Anaeromyxobacter oryzae]|uniref:MFS transporter n=1 Tax=Anaeromyxobacter oryzae TaxID=2918170 RepID=A0ABN6MMW9_9BACT|nr:MFS transporter [Anaeromyxobacter oryzae]BDG02394.1 hypothetical protein AMOR_13900 [Anaeromyxobacter oryzae]